MSTAGNKGFTLIEVLVAVVIFAVGIVAVSRAYMTSVGALGIGRDSVQALCLLKQKMSELEFSALEADGLATGVSSGTFDADNAAYEWASEVSPAAYKLNELGLDVRKTGSQRHYTLATYVDEKK
ncbi:MAG: prepilin-type N-terminal cleavage/methylation domain-containing protein [Candidatus Omnitrophota bacterium]|jgi:type II secretion system protein I